MKIRTEFEVCILAGGASSRMGEDKARVRIDRRTMLGTIRAEAQKLGMRVRVIRHDLVERCGPLGGVFTGLKTAKSGVVLFLACDMPMVTVEFLRKIIGNLDEGLDAVFAQSEGVGFPFILRTKVLPKIEEQIIAREYSVHRLCRKLEGKVLYPTPEEAVQLMNVNSQGDLELVRKHISARAGKS